MEPTRTAPCLVGTGQVAAAKVTGSQLALGFLPLLRAGLFPAVPGASVQEVVWGLKTGTEHCPSESWGPPSHGQRRRGQDAGTSRPRAHTLPVPMGTGWGQHDRQHFLLTFHGILSGLARTPDR